MPIPRRLIIIHPSHFFKWNYNTPDTTGIGNSETAQIEVSRGFAERGWEVINYAPIPDDTITEWRGTWWYPLEEVDYTIPGYWLIWRHPPTLDHFPEDHPDQHLSLVCQDNTYSSWNADRLKKLDLIFGLCPAHVLALQNELPLFKDKIRESSNGIRLGAMCGWEATHPAPPRDPHRILYASSPDRALPNLLRIFRRVRQLVSDATLFIAYGFDNWDKYIVDHPEVAYIDKQKEEILKAAQQPGVTWLGRLPQPQLWEEWRKSALSVYPTTFCETSFVSLMEAQALGAIPINSPIWAAGSNVLAGSLIPGDPGEELTQSRFVCEIYRWMSNVGLQEEVRPELTEAARRKFSWRKQVDKYESALLGLESLENLHTMIEAIQETKEFTDEFTDQYYFVGERP